MNNQPYISAQKTINTRVAYMAAQGFDRSLKNIPTKKVQNFLRGFYAIHENKLH